MAQACSRRPYHAPGSRHPSDLNARPPHLIPPSAPPPIPRQPLLLILLEIPRGIPNPASHAVHNPQPDRRAPHHPPHPEPRPLEPRSRRVPAQREQGVQSGPRRRHARGRGRHASEVEPGREEQGRREEGEGQHAPGPRVQGDGQRRQEGRWDRRCCFVRRIRKKVSLCFFFISPQVVALL